MHLFEDFKKGLDIIAESENRYSENLEKLSIHFPKGTGGQLEKQDIDVYSCLSRLI